MEDHRIPFNRPWLTGDEPALLEALARSGHLSGDGPFTHQCQARLEKELAASRVLLTTSGTHALELAAMLTGVGPGDEVILPSFTFVSTANAFALRGAHLVFADIRPDTLNIDERVLPELASERTRVVVPVHYAGVGCEMGPIMEFARSQDATVVEDNALGLFGSHRGQSLGSFGALTALSFHETKSFSCGEGGALVVNDSTLVERAEILREKGTDRSRFFRGEVDKYTWREIGSSYLPSDILAALLLAQLERSDQVIALRRSIWDRYHERLAAWATAGGVQQPFVPEYDGHGYGLYHLVLPSASARDAFLRHMKQQGILAVFHYLPLHDSPAGRRFHDGRSLPVTESVSARLARLPFFNAMTEDQVDTVIDAVTNFRV